MKRFWIVITSVALMVAAVLLHKNAVATIVGIVVGTPYFLAAFASGGGLAEVRITGGRKPNDPSASVGMGLAAAGIASTAMADPNYPISFRTFYILCFIAGLLIATVFAAKSAKSTPADSKTDETGTIKTP